MGSVNKKQQGKGKKRRGLRTGKEGSVGWESRICVGQQKESIWVVVKEGECLAVLVVADVDIQTHNNGTDLAE